ncbi:MAG: polymer-forming cytoskeletal protein [Lachnospiraceae bacterium]|nr:polymer-forming cytoskeletal protein [Lachnospiraceae bacterium]
MGFFQDLREDLSQAVNELVPDTDKEEKDLSEESLFAAAEEAMGIERAADVADMIAASEDMDKALAEYADSTEEVAISIPETMMTMTDKPLEYSKPAEVSENPSAPQVSDEIATITQCMTVNGDVISNGSLDLIGAVNGNIHVLGKLNITGEIVGNSEASEVYAQGANITGDVSSSGAVKVGQNTVIRGNIYATSAIIAGAVKGDIDVHGPVILDSTAIVMGNIKSKAVQINNGAAVEGMCSQCYADVSPSNFFKD